LISFFLQLFIPWIWFRPFLKCFIFYISLLILFSLSYYGRQGHGSVKEYYVYGEKELLTIRKRQQEKHYCGNAPPMRALPLAFTLLHYYQGSSLPFLSLDEILKLEYNEKWLAELCLLSRLSSDTTHPHRHGQTSCFAIAYAGALLWFFRRPPSEILSDTLQALKFCMDKKFLDYDEETLKYYKNLDQLPSWYSSTNLNTFSGPYHLDIQSLVGPEFASLGLPVSSMHTAGCVLYFLKYSRSLMEGLMVSLHIGGDVDSLASILLGLLCGYYTIPPLVNEENLQVEERRTIPKWIFEKLEGIKYTQIIAKDLFNSLQSDILANRTK